MSNIGELNVRIGAEIQQLERGIRQAESALRRSNQQFEAWGNRLTMTLTTSLGGLGVLAIKNAGQMESLRKALETTMQDGGYATAQARDELQKLFVAAKAPGLDFEQAVKGSVRLQSVKMSAEKARETLIQLANAVAMAGGDASNLDGVTKQFSQMIAKGRIMQEDLTIIQENMPGISKAMDDAFGTRSAEKLRAMGVTADQFIAGVTKELAKLPRVSGGISNSIVNAGVAIKTFLASIGDSLNKTFNISGKLDYFSEWMGGLAQRFDKLDDGTKRLVFGVGVFALALGPAVKAANMMVQAGGLVYTTFTRMQIAMKSIQVGGFAEWFAKVNLAMKVSVIGAVAAAVIALGLAFKATAQDMSAAAVAARTVEEVNKSVADSTAAERLEATRLADVLRSETATRDQKHAALVRLKAIAPDIFGQLQEERLKIDDVNTALATYIKRIEQRARLAAMNAKLVETEKAIYDAQNGLADNTNMLQDAYNALWGGIYKAVGAGTDYNEMTRETRIRNSKELLPSLEATKDALLKEITALEMSTEVKKQNTSATAAQAGANQSLEDSFKKLDKAQKLRARMDATARMKKDVGGGASPMLPMVDVMPESVERLKAVEDPIKRIALAAANALTPVQALQKAFDTMDDTATALGETKSNLAKKIDATKSAISEAISQGYSPFSNQVQTLQTMLENLQLAQEGVQGSFSNLAKTILESSDPIQSALDASVGQANYMMLAMSAAAQAAGQGMMQAAEQGKTSFKELAKSAAASAAKVVRAWVMQGVAAAVSKALTGVPFPFNIAAGAAAGGIVGALFNSLLGKIGIPALAEGGLATGPTLAMVGDNLRAGAGDPEVIAPLSKLRGMLDGGGGGDLRVYGTLRASGNDLLVVIEGAQRDRLRTRGY